MTKAYVCQVCRKEGQWVNIRDHIETKHIKGISIPAAFICENNSFLFCINCKHSLCSVSLKSITSEGKIASLRSDFMADSPNLFRLPGVV